MLLTQCCRVFCVADLASAIRSEVNAFNVRNAAYAAAAAAGMCGAGAAVGGDHVKGAVAAAVIVAAAKVAEKRGWRDW